MTCFNPCFCGTGARTGRLSVFMVSEERVSILVFVELALELYTVHGYAYRVLVSILVFVELALERHVRGVFLWNWRSNPNTSDHNYYSD